MASKDFFLEPDDAQTMGDTNYMKKPVKVRRTFPKTLTNPNGFAIEKQVSATEQVKFPENGSSFASSTPDYMATSNGINGSTSDISSVNNIEKRRPVDSNMDMFRKMAKKIGRK